MKTPLTQRELHVALLYGQTIRKDKLYDGYKNTNDFLLFKSQQIIDRVKFSREAVALMEGLCSGRIKNND